MGLSSHYAANLIIIRQFSKKNQQNLMNIGSEIREISTIHIITF